jgi:hypothetical protein
MLFCLLFICYLLFILFVAFVSLRRALYLVSSLPTASFSSTLVLSRSLRFFRSFQCRFNFTLCSLLSFLHAVSTILALFCLAYIAIHSRSVSLFLCFASAFNSNLLLFYFSYYRPLVSLFLLSAVYTILALLFRGLLSCFLIFVCPCAPASLLLFSFLCFCVPAYYILALLCLLSALLPSNLIFFALLSSCLFLFFANYTIFPL